MEIILINMSSSQQRNRTIKSVESCIVMIFLESLWDLINHRCRQVVHKKNKKTDSIIFHIDEF